MPIGTCDPATRGEDWNHVTIEEHLVDGAILIDCRYGWDGTSTRETGCDGPVQDIRVRNTATVAGHARLPNKRRGQKWIEISPGTDVTLSGATLSQLGLTAYSDVAGVSLSATSG